MMSKELQGIGSNLELQNMNEYKKTTQRGGHLCETLTFLNTQFYWNQSIK